MRGTRTLRFEVAEPRRCLTMLSFATHEVAVEKPHGLLAGDFDGDGDLDLFAGDAWYANIDGTGRFGASKTVLEIEQALQVADLDDDGDLDLLGRNANGQLAWYENTDGAGSFAWRQSVSRWGPMAVGDLDNDGQKDIVMSASNRIVWHRNEGDQFGRAQTLVRRAQGSVALADLDEDGSLDVLVGSEVGVRWYPNTDGTATLGEPRAITTTRSGMVVEDMDGDGDLDVITDYGDTGTVAWHRNLNTGSDFEEVASVAAPVGRIIPADFDGDQDLDLLFFSSGFDLSSVGWIENANGVLVGAAAIEQVTTQVTSIALGDFDGDQDPDFAWTPSRQLTWHELTSVDRTVCAPRFTPDAVLATDRVGVSYETVDLDGDGDVDLFSRQSGTFAIRENRGFPEFGPPQQIDARGVTSFADLDGDGDLELLAIDEEFRSVWHENLGSAEFGTPRLLEGAIGWPDVAGDIDGDGDWDVLVRSATQVGWYENTDGRGAFAPQRVIFQDELRLLGDIRRAELVDVDGDGDLDAFLTQGVPHWLENVDGRGTFGAPIPLPTGIAEGSVFLRDLDGDGDLDVLGSLDSRSSGLVFVWDENLGGGVIPPSSPPRLQVGENANGGPLWVGDIDGDGAVDVLAKRSWYRNTTPGFGTEHRVVVGEAQDLVDLDGDGDLDILVRNCDDETCQLVAYLSDLAETRLPADADGDGEVGFADFLQFASHFGSTDVGWAKGDFDGDNEVTMDDFLILAANFGRTR